MSLHLKLKLTLFKHCQTYADERIARAKTAMETAQKSANTESKSSAGDKYETGRAMMQIERDKNAILLGEAQKLKQALSQINPNSKHSEIQLGSVALTDQGTFFFSISVGHVNVLQQMVTCLSPGSPLGQAFLTKTTGDVITFNSRVYKISGVI